MSSEKWVSQYIALKDDPLWKLLSADSAPYVIGILQTVLYDNRDERLLKASAITFRVGLELDRLRESGLTELARPAQEYLNIWVSAGYLIRRLPAGGTEEEYELSAASIDAIRFVTNMADKKVAVTESRLSLVTDALSRLADDTDPDMTRRAERLKEDRDRIERELELIETGQATVLPLEVSLERIREIIGQSKDLLDDFRHVMDRFNALHRNLREKLLVLDETKGRGDVALEVFDGIRVIETSEAGRSFDAFYAMLTNEGRQGSLGRSLEAAYESEYFQHLTPEERDYLYSLVPTLLKQSMIVHLETTALSKSLENLVRSRAFRERRILMELITEAKKAALEVKDDISPVRSLELTLKLTSVRLSSADQLKTFDPDSVFSAEPMRRANSSLVDFTEILGSIIASEIDYRALREQIVEALNLLKRASIADVLNLYPATQGLGTVVGLIHLAHRHGERGQGHETVSWDGLDGVHRSARIDLWYFLIERIDEFYHN
ncbi:MAG: DUF3375 domain-containing protein [Deltaproteobacteria bacterium]|jgi:hypothetical protein|nr:DUF3375 domain-containing protein [Deltaproteobacteria bacterium]